jgi:hypothetical protein
MEASFLFLGTGYDRILVRSDYPCFEVGCHIGEGRVGALILVEIYYCSGSFYRDGAARMSRVGDGRQLI